MVSLGIREEGLDEYRRSVDRFRRDFDDVRDVAVDEAADLVVVTARPRFPVMRGRARRGLVARDNEVVHQSEHGPFIDFGGRVGRRRSVVRPFRRRGRYVLPSLDDLERGGDIERLMDRAVAEEARRAGLEVD